MAKRLLSTFTLLAALGVGAPLVMAYNPQHDHDDQWESRDGYEYRTYQGDRPEGWNHGKKTGWDNCGMPPGQAKKHGCYTYSYQGRPYYYYEGADGRMYVRRPSGHHDHDHDHDGH